MHTRRLWCQYSPFCWRWRKLQLHTQRLGVRCPFASLTILNSSLTLVALLSWFDCLASDTLYIWNVFFFFIKNLWKLRTFSLPLCFLSPWVFWWLIAVHCFSHTFHPLRHTWLLALIFPNREATHWKSSILYSIIGLVSYKSFNSLFLVDLENLYLFTFFQNRSRFCLTRSVSLQRNWNVCLSNVIGDLVLFLVHNQTHSPRRLL